VKQLIESLAAANAPQHILAALEAFQFHNPSADRLSKLSELERNSFFRWCDGRQLTFMLPYVCDSLPQWVTQTVQDKTARYNLRFERITRELFEITGAFDDAKLPFVMLKGLSHSPVFTPDASLRGQGDIDLWLLGPSVYRARDVLRRLGYVPTLAATRRHLPPMSRPTEWKWRGDIHDPEMPISVELHYELWSGDTDFIAAPGVKDFWERKRLRSFDGRAINVLCDEDLLAFATLHLLLHVLHGDLPLQRAWEIAHFLDTHVNDHEFWQSWRALHPTALRQLEMCIFCLVTEWFGCYWPKNLNIDFQTLPDAAIWWLRSSSLAPLRREWKPNKSELLLHLALITKRGHRFAILIRRLIPLSLPLFIDDGTAPPSWQSRVLATVRQSPRLFGRLLRHVMTFFPTLFEGLRWLVLRKL
jgi:hypothetical protein